MKDLDANTAGVAILHWVADHILEKLKTDTALFTPCALGEQIWTVGIQRIQGVDDKVVRIDTLVPEGRARLTEGSKFVMQSGPEVFATGIIWVPPKV